MKPIRYLSVCSGMEAASVAWEPLGWVPVGFSEIAPFPSAILKHRFPNIPNYGNLLEYKQWPIAPGSIDLLVGGTPCQSFSVAGLRKGLDDPRGNLALVFLGLVDRLQPKWVVWENVPGALSSNGGRDFGSFLGALVKLGYGFAYRVLNAENFGVPQRRRRVFLVACRDSGGWSLAAQVLFKPESLPRDTPSGRQTENDNPRRVKESIGRRVCVTGLTTHCLTKSYQGSEDGTGRGLPIVIDRAAFNQGENAQYDPHIERTDIMDTLVSKGPHAVAVPPGLAVRKLTPRETERLQGFPDDWSKIPWKGKPADECPDGPRYQACGNSMAVPCMRWIGEQIQQVERGNK